MTGVCWILLLFLTLAPLAPAQPSSLPRDDFWVPDGQVKAIVETNGVVYIGGLFEYISPVSLTGNAFDPASGAALPGFPKFNGAIKAIVTDNAGGWFVGGLFTAVGGSPITNLAHIFADRTVDRNWTPNPDNAVLALAASSAMLYVGGSFLQIGGQAHSLLAAVDPVTGAVLSWRADVTTTFPKATVNALALSEGSLYIGGYFSFINGAAREHVGSVDALTGQVTSWYPNGYTGAEAGARVDALAASGNVLYVGGTFASIGGWQSNAVPRHYLAALDTTKDLTNSVLPWNPNADGPVTSFALSCDTVYVGGLFSSIGGQPRNRIAALDMNTGQATAWNPNANSAVLKVVLAGNTLYAGGKFTQIGGQTREFLAALDTSTGEATLWRPKADFGVAGLVLSGGSVVAGGSLGSGGKQRSNAAAFDARTGRPLDWNPQITGATIINGNPNEGVYAMAASSNMIYFGGPFTTINGQARPHAGAVDALSGAVKNWAPNADVIVETLLNSGGTIYAGGLFSSIGGRERANLAALDPITGTATAWNPAPNDKVSALAALGNTIYTGGLFKQVGTQARNRLAALDGSTSVASTWNPNVNDQVSAISVLGGTLYFGGQFSMVSTQLANRLAAVDRMTGNLTCWQPNPQLITRGGKTNSAAVNVVVAYSNLVYAGGTFTLIGGQARNNLAALRTNCPGAATAWDPNVDASVTALALVRGAVFSGGLFQNVNGQYRPFFAVFPPAGSPTITNQPQSQLVANGQNVSFIAAASGQLPLSYQWQLNGTNLPGATNPSLLIPNAQVSNSGDYTLVVTNSLGLINSRPANLTVVQPVAIVTQPLSQTVAPGANVTLSVVATGNPPPIYQWRLNGVNIPGGVYPTLTLTNAQPTNGGNYSVIVANIGGALSSEIATLLVTSAALPFTDILGSHFSLSAASGTGSGSNVGATREPGEPHHASKIGGRSVWLGWIAPANGIATFSTRGSSFDTLLAIYTNDFSLNPQPSTSNLGTVAEDEDRGGYFTSQASFNATAGTEYLIAIDGFAGAAGNMVLSWSLDTITVPFPRILTQPLSLSALVGQDVSFAVTVNSATPVSYQWYLGCALIPGATNAMLTVTNMQRGDVGGYRVVVRNASSQAAQSEVAALEIGPEPKFISQDKVEDLFPELLNVGLARQSKGGLRAGSVAQGFISIPLGNIDSQIVDNTGATTQQGEPLHCGALGGASEWLRLRPQSDGVFIIDTIGSSIDTVLAVYYSTNLLWLSTALVACDDNGAPDGIRSQVQFAARGGSDYLVAVDGVNAARGTINVNWKFGQPPISTPPPPPHANADGTLTLMAQATNVIPAPSYQWFLNGIKISGATNSTWLVHSPSAALGTYSVWASNFAGSVVQTVATLMDLAYEAHLQNGVLRLRLPSDLSQPVLLQGSSNLVDWVAVQIIDPTQSRLVEVTVTNSRVRFFRVHAAR